MKRNWVALGLVLGAGLGLGCREERPVVFDPNLVHAHKYAMTEELPMEQVLSDSQWALEKMFGTPDDPKLPEVVAEDEDLASIVSLERLQHAAGPVGGSSAGEGTAGEGASGEDAAGGGAGLYRLHCAACHGVTGDGRGPTGAILNPYPRDYRMGVFKFKSTTRGAKPTREDLVKLIRDGIPGTAMVKIPGLSEEDLESLVDYVIYLSWRGELERRMIDDAVLELDVAAGDPENRIIVPEFANATAEEEKELFEEQWSYISDYVVEIGETWLEAEDEVTEVELPEDIPVPANRAEFVAMMNGPEAEELKASVERGQKLFVGAVASCAKCHGLEGKGDGQTNDFDDWAKDWTVRVGLDPKDREQLIPLLARGALMPQNVQPRNFAEGVFRGGSDPESLYRRIVNGIAGTPMPGATFVDGEFEEKDVWHVINYIRSLEQAAPQTETVAGPAAEGKAAS